MRNEYSFRSWSRERGSAVRGAVLGDELLDAQPEVVAVQRRLELAAHADGERLQLLLERLGRVDHLKAGALDGLQRAIVLGADLLQQRLPQLLRLLVHDLLLRRREPLELL